MKKQKTSYIGIITIYKNVYIEAESDKEAWSLFQDKISKEKAEIEDCYFVDADNSHLTK